jgi:predicted hotdog family 3-hydroxylacyl-ACP dehydratase
MSTAIEQLIPHRAPMRWVDELCDCTDTTATATTRFTAGHYAVAHPESERRLLAAAGNHAKTSHLPPEGAVPSGASESELVIETALVECLAQTVAAALGHRMRASGQPGAANQGMLAAVSNFKILTPPPLDQTLTIEIREVKRLGPMLLITGKISCGAALIATGDLSLYA